MQLIFTENGQIYRIVNMDNIIQVAKHVTVEHGLWFRTVEHGLWFCCGMSSDGTACGFTLKLKDEATVNYALDQIRMGSILDWPATYVPIDKIPKEENDG